MSTQPLWVLDYEGPTWREQGDEWTRFAGQPKAREATKSEMVAALIAEGGETIWWCEAEERMMAMEPDVPWGVHDCSAELGCGWRLVFGPIPVESAEAKETP